MKSASAFQYFSFFASCFPTVRHEGLEIDLPVTTGQSVKRNSMDSNE